MNVWRYECRTGGHYKFWEIAFLLGDYQFRTTWGRIGTVGVSKVKSFKTQRECSTARQRLIAEKLAKGYVRVSSTGSNESLPVVKAKHHTRPAKVATVASRLEQQSADDAPASSTRTGDSSSSGRPRRRVRFN